MKELRKPSRAMTDSVFPSDLFLNSTSAERTLRTIHEAFLASGSQYPVDEFSHALLNQLRVSPDPEMALTNFLRFAEAGVSKASLFNDLLHYPVLFEVLVKVFGHSQYFADILVRDPELFRWLTGSDSLVKPRTRETITTEVRRTEQMFQKHEHKLDGLKRLYRRELLRIGVRDILGEADLATVTQELSHLADCLIDACCRIAEEQLSHKYPAVPKTPYTVIGLGKLGGGELNYSSDIDILFVYGKEGKLKHSTRRTATNHEYFNLFVEKIVQNLSQASAEGHLYRVDTRLRPESGAGPLARSVRSFLTYYESRGELWERQMLIKARPVAGDVDFGRKFLQQLEPFVYPRTFFHHPAESIARIKARIETAIGDEENIKLRAGGIRDIEFIVQALQLLNGGKVKTVRESNTLHALDVLKAEGLLAKTEASTLRKAYIFFRTLEHRLQTMLNTQTHTLPGDQRGEETLAKRMAMSSAIELRTQTEVHTKAVKQIFDATLSVDDKIEEAALSAIIDGNTGEAATLRVLARYGFQDSRRAAKNLASLTLGSSLTGSRNLDARVQSAFRALADDLFTEIAATASPDMTLHNLTLLAGSQKWPDLFFTQLGEKEFRKLILTICGVSPRFAKGLARHPLLLEILSTDARAFSGGKKPVPRPGISEVLFKNEEEIRAGVRHLLGFSTFDELATDLTQLADVIVSSTFTNICRTYRARRVPLAVLSVGKYGTREINFDADLDLIFLADPRPPMTLDNLENIAAAIVGELSAVSGEGRMYDVDARLRPEGKSAPLVVARDAYRKYLNERASLWERQSLTRVRFVCGDETLGKKVLNDIEEFVYGRSLPTSWIHSTVAMRRKMESRSRTHQSDYCDIKLGPGGMADIEFLAQVIQLQFGRDRTELRGKRTGEVLKLAELFVLSKDEVCSLMKAYGLYRQIEKFIRVTLEEPGTLLPDGSKLDLLARLVGVGSGDALRIRIDSTMQQTREMFLEINQRLSQL